MKYEVHKLNNRKLPFIFRDDEMNAGERDFTHWHENIELLYFYEGEGVVTVDFKSVCTGKGDLFVINSEKLHMVESAHKAYPVKYYCLIIDTDFCIENGIPVTELHFKDLICNNHEIGERFMAIVNAYKSKQEFRETAVRIAALSLLLALARGFLVGEEGEKNIDDAHLKSVKRAIAFIKENYENNISMEQIARAAGLSKAYFSRIFKAFTGYTVVSYINLVRCRNAAKLLKSGKYKINEIAVQCGFENFSYFTRTYKQVMGVLPSKERENGDDIEK